MKLHTLVLVLCVSLCLFVAHGCKTTPEQAAAIQARVNAATADGVVTETEAKEIAVLMKEQGSSIDWSEILKIGIGSLSAFLVTNLYRNKTSASRTAADLVTLEVPKVLA